MESAGGRTNIYVDAASQPVSQEISPSFSVLFSLGISTASTHLLYIFLPFTMVYCEVRITLITPCSCKGCDACICNNSSHSSDGQATTSRRPLECNGPRLSLVTGCREEGIPGSRACAGRGFRDWADLAVTPHTGES